MTPSKSGTRSAMWCRPGPRLSRNLEIGESGAAGSKNQFYLYAGGTGGNSTLQGGAGNDTFHIETNTGNDTIIGGGGHDVVDLDKQASTDLAGAPELNSNGSYTLVFDDGQHITVSGISSVHFSDGVKFTP